MARVTVEDCIEKITNRFDLVLVAAQRARSISKGDPLTIERDNDKNPVVALREIADETIDNGEIEGDLISSLQRMNRREEEQAMRDEAASLAQDEMSLTDNMSDDDVLMAGMQIGHADDAEGQPADAESPFAAEGDISDEEDIPDDGSFADEAEAPKED